MPVSYTHLVPAAAVMGAGLTSGRDRKVTSSVIPRVKRSLGASFSSSLNRAKMEKDQPKERFTLGITDDVTGLSLPEIKPAPITAAAGTKECKFWGCLLYTSSGSGEVRRLSVEQYVFQRSSPAPVKRRLPRAEGTKF